MSTIQILVELQVIARSLPGVAGVLNKYQKHTNCDLHVVNYHQLLPPTIKSTQIVIFLLANVDYCGGNCELGGLQWWTL